MRWRRRGGCEPLRSAVRESAAPRREYHIRIIQREHPRSTRLRKTKPRREGSDRVELIRSQVQERSLRSARTNDRQHAFADPDLELLVGARPPRVAAAELFHLFFSQRRERRFVV